MRSILVVEDEQLVAEDIRLTLEGYGYRVVGTATTGEVAVRLAGESRPDLVLMDIYLAGEMTGIEAAGEIRRRFDIPVIFLTAFSDEDIIRKVREIGPYGYLLKPFNEQEMYITIEIAFYRHTMDRALRESEQRYRLFVEHFQGVAFRLSMDLAPVFYHGSLSRITGYTEDEIISGNPSWRMLVHPDDRGSYDEQVERAGTVPGYTNEFQYRIIDRNGTIRWIEELLQNVVDSMDEPQFIQGSLFDITGRVAAEERLRDLNRRLDGLVKQRTLDLERTNRELFLKNRALQIRSSATGALVFAETEDDLLRGIMRNLEASGGYRALWLATFGDDFQVRTVTSFGEICGLFGTPDTVASLPPCIRKAIYRDSAVVMEELCPISDECPGLSEGIRPGTLAAGLCSRGKLLGVVCAALPPHIAPDEPEITLFEEMAREITLTIDHLRAVKREKRALDRISRTLEQFATLNDHIRNPLQGIVGYASLEDDERSKKIISLSMQINEIVNRLDRGYLESKKVRFYLERHEGVTLAGPGRETQPGDDEPDYSSGGREKGGD